MFHLRGQEETENGRILIEGIDEALSLSSVSHIAIDSKKLVASLQHESLDDVEHDLGLREDKASVSLGTKVGEQLDKKHQLA